jgi:uncharacterized protein (DUF1810 family)
MNADNTLNRFIDAQETSYQTALSEIESGKKQSHWMWYVFPQIHGLSLSETSKYYAIKSLDEAAAYLAHPVLGSRLIKISTVLLGLESNDAFAIFGNPDETKLKSSMTLFASVPNTNPVFKAVLNKFFSGQMDAKTLQTIA